MVVSKQQQQRSSSSSAAAAAKRNNNNSSSSTSAQAVEPGTQHRQQHQEEPSTPRYQQQQHQSQQEHLQQQLYQANPVYMLETERHSDSPYGNGGSNAHQHYHAQGQSRAATTSLSSSSSGPRVIVVEDLLVGENSGGGGVVGSGGEQGSGLKMRSAAQSISYVHAPLQHPGDNNTMQALRSGKSGKGHHHPTHHALVAATGYAVPSYEHMPISSYLDSAHGLGNLGGGEVLTSLSSPSSSSNHCSSLNSASDLGITTVYTVIGDKLTPSSLINTNSNDQNGSGGSGDDQRMLIIGPPPNYRQPTPSSIAASLHHHHLIGGLGGPSSALINGANLSTASTQLNSSPYLSCYDTSTMGGGDYSAYYQTFTAIQWCAPPTNPTDRPLHFTQHEGEAPQLHLQRLRNANSVSNSLPQLPTKSAHREHYQPTQTPPVRTQPPAPGETNNGSARSSTLHYASLPSQQQQSGLQHHHSAPDDSPTLSVDGDNDGDISEGGGGGGGRRAARNGRDSDGLGHTARTPPETLEWLSRNYEPCSGASLPRCTLYYQYLNHCHELDLEPVNAASFGKLIRSVFKGLKTRRLGTRGNSKYHYDGIRIKLGSPLHASVPPQEFGGARMAGGMGRTIGMRNSRRLHSALNGGRSASLYQPPPSAVISMAEQDDPPAYHLRPRTNSSVVTVSSVTGGDVVVRSVSESSVDYTTHQQQCDENEHANGNGIVVTCGAEGALHSNGISNSSSGTLLNTSGDTTTTISDSMRETPPMGLPNTAAEGLTNRTGSRFEAAGGGEMPHVPRPDLCGMQADLGLLDITAEMVDEFVDGYRRNCEKVLDCVKHLHFDSIERVWSEFWLLPTTDHQSEPNGGGSGDQLGRICSLAPVQDFVHRMDIGLYQVLVDVLIPDVLRTVLSRRLSCQIRYFARNVEQWMAGALNGGSTATENSDSLPPKFREMKLASARLFVLALTRYTSFNHLADAARAVLRNEEQIAQMYSDFCRVDFSIVHSQADWVCGCDPQLVASIEADFRENLRLQKNLDEWTEWMEAVVDQMLACYHDRPIEVLAKASKQFLLKWSFYSSMILRDVTYRSAQSFGSFHLIRLLYDEYMNILVESRLAKATNQPVICVMGGDWMRNLANGREDSTKGNLAGGGEEPMPQEYENLIDAATDIAEIHPSANTLRMEDTRNDAICDPENNSATAHSNEEDVIMRSVKEEVIS